MFNSIIKSVLLCCVSFLFLFSFTLAQGEKGAALYQDSDVCGFSGLLPNSNPSLWKDTEFSLLLKDERAPGYFLMTRFIELFAVTDNRILKAPSCEVSKYVKALIEYYNENESIIQKKHENVADLLSFIKRKLNSE